MSSEKAYHRVDGKLCVKYDARVISLPLWKKFHQQNPHATRQRGGNGRPSLLELNAIPEPYKSRIIQMHGDPDKAENPLLPYFTLDPKARRFFDDFHFDNGNTLLDDQKLRFTINASTLNALIELKSNRETMRKGLSGSSSGLWKSLINDVAAFKNHLKAEYGMCHNLPKSSRLKARLKNYQDKGYISLVDQRSQNTNAQKVTDQMEQLWNDLFATLSHKPDKTEIHFLYCLFLAGKKEIINSRTGEMYDPNDQNLLPVSESCIGSYLSKWVNRAATHKKRSGNRQQYMSQYKPFHKLNQPKCAGSMISVDDRQPPFWYDKGSRMWFYNGIDLGSEAFTTWVYGESKEGIILDFYRQMVRNYAQWNIPMPYELEGEMALNASFKNTFLAPGAMFQAVRIEANNARGKRIEAYYRQLRYGLEKKREGWLARPFAISEPNQPSDQPEKILPRKTIIQNCLRDIQKWNNTLHSNQQLHKGLTRWQVFTKKQHPDLPATNWRGILPHLGYQTPTSMRAGRITLQGMHRVVGLNGNVALGEDLIRIMSKIEGQPVTVYWLDDDKGNVLKAHVHDSQDNRFICELMEDLSYSRSTLEQTDEDRNNRSIMSAYANTVTSFITQQARSLNRLEVMDSDITLSEVEEGEFKIPGLESEDQSPEETEILPPVDREEDHLNSNETDFKTDTKSRF